MRSGCRRAQNISYSKERQCALELFQEMRAQGLQADVITYNATISACEKGKQWQRALGLLEEMLSQGIRANVITYNATISACGKGKQWQRALGCWRRCSRRECRQT